MCIPAFTQGGDLNDKQAAAVKQALDSRLTIIQVLRIQHSIHPACTLLHQHNARRNYHMLGAV
jgi:hypothetical protein